MPLPSGSDPGSNRRRFLGAAVATAASYGRIFGANDRIRIAGIGTGGRGEYDLSNAAKAEGTEMVGFCDVYEPHRLRAKSRLAPAAPDYVDYREVLDRKDVDAVVVGTPDHWHVPVVIDAVRAGKDVYCEKPVTHTLGEGAPLIAAVQETKRIVQTGTQQRSWPHFIHAKEAIAGGALGQVTFIRTYWYQNHIANQDAVHVDVSKLDWKRFLGSASARPFDADQYAHWRWYWDFGGGAMTDLFIHWVDVAQWYMNDDQPVRATASGVKALLQQRQTPDTMSAALQYGKTIVEFDSSLLGYIEGGGLMIRGTKGAMRLHRSGFEVYNEIPRYSEGFTMPPVVMEEKSTRDGSVDHMQNFLDCVRSRKTPNAPVEVGVAAARAGHVANLAMRGSGVWTA
ncbi:MAG: Gfo/Idh/MocA family oxidoreductase [Acidobacteria bacterium]|nr:Gfo/Idh/MocA family oxidoreductase [Acidobacteriota bacterium]